MQHNKSIKFNIITSIILQIITAICGFIIPRLLIINFGSETNGLVHSISQFLSYVTLLEAGIGVVAKASLYKPLIAGNKEQINLVVKKVQNFYNKIFFIYLIYSTLLALCLPFLLKTTFSYEYICSLIIISAISNISNYFIGVPMQILLQADNKLYYVNIVNSLARIINAALTILFVCLNWEIHYVVLTSSLIFFLKPFLLYFIVKKKYNLKLFNIKTKEKLPNRWDGFAQHLAFFINQNTDITILSTMMDISYVSVYSVYTMITNAASSFLISIIKSYEGTLGLACAKGNSKEINLLFARIIKILFPLIILIYGSIFFLINSFISIYTSDFNDFLYVDYTFSFFLILSQLFYCFRVVYSTLAYANGNIKETRNSAIIEAVLNIFISITLVFNFGLTGIAIGTCVAMFYRLVYFVYFDSKYILKCSCFKSIKHILFNVLVLHFAFMILVRIFPIPPCDIKEWIYTAFITLLIIGIPTLLVYYFNFYKNRGSKLLERRSKNL